MSPVATRARARQLALGAPVHERARGEALDCERPRRERSSCSDGGGLTLEQQLQGVWEGLRAVGVAICPLCGGRMAAHAGASGGACDSCGTMLE